MYTCTHTKHLGQETVMKRAFADIAGRNVHGLIILEGNLPIFSYNCMIIVWESHTHFCCTDNSRWRCRLGSITISL